MNLQTITAEHAEFAENTMFSALSAASAANVL